SPAPSLWIDCCCPALSPTHKKRKRFPPSLRIAGSRLIKSAKSLCTSNYHRSNNEPRRLVESGRFPRPTTRVTPTLQGRSVLTPTTVPFETSTTPPHQPLRPRPRPQPQFLREPARLQRPRRHRRHQRRPLSRDRPSRRSGHSRTRRS